MPSFLHASRLGSRWSRNQSQMTPPSDRSTSRVSLIDHLPPRPMSKLAYASQVLADVAPSSCEVGWCCTQSASSRSGSWPPVRCRRSRSFILRKIPVISISGTSNFSLVLNSQAGRYSRVERVLHVIYTANKICKIDEPFWSTAAS